MCHYRDKLSPQLHLTGTLWRLVGLIWAKNNEINASNISQPLATPHAQNHHKS
jgi:hypothetical protein